MNEVGRGIADIGRALDFLKARPRLWTWLIAPALVTLVLLVAVVLGIVHATDPLITWVAAHVPGWLAGVITWALRIVIVVGLGMAAMLAVVAVAGVIAGPFNELLSEAVEEALTGVPSPPFRLGPFLRDALLGIAHALRRLGGALLWIVGLFALGLIPVIGTIAALVLGAYLAARSAAYDSFDAVLARRGLSYRDKLAYLARCDRRSLGLGGAVAGMLLVPGLNLIALGLGATAATLAAHELDAVANLGARTGPGR